MGFTPFSMATMFLLGHQFHLQQLLGALLASHLVVVYHMVALRVLAGDLTQLLEEVSQYEPCATHRLPAHCTVMQQVLELQQLLYKSLGRHLALLRIQ